MSLARVQPVFVPATPSPAAQVPALPGLSFAEQLRAAGRDQVVDDTEQAAQQFVAGAFVEPILAIARESSMMAEGAFAPGHAERRFGPLLDQKLADDVVRSASFPLVTRIREHMLELVAKSVPVSGAIDVTH